jgi:membrane fusion protein, multidrug efflux system
MMRAGNLLNMKSWFLPAFVLGCICAAGCNGSHSRERVEGELQPDSGTTLSTVVAERTNVPIFVTGPGTAMAYQTVTVKTRVDGEILKIAFKEGQNVKKGDLLLVIDPKPYEAALKQSEANLFRDKAALDVARLTLDRDRKLYAEDLIPKQQLDVQESTVAQCEGTVQADEAQTLVAKLNIEYTHIISPVDGRVGLQMVDVGNMVHASDANGLVVLSQLTPIAVVFALPQQLLPSILGRLRQGHAIKIEAYTQDDQTKLGEGELLTVDNEIDPATSTAKFKGVLDNRQMLLWPNQSINIRILLETRRGAITIPSAAVQHGVNGNFVCALTGDHKISLRLITVIQIIGKKALVGKGINSGDVLLTDCQAHSAEKNPA